MSKDMVTVWRNEFNDVIERGGEQCLSEEKTVLLALELEDKLRPFAEN